MNKKSYRAKKTANADSQQAARAAESFSTQLQRFDDRVNHSVLDSFGGDEKYNKLYWDARHAIAAAWSKFDAINQYLDMNQERFPEYFRDEPR